VDGYARFDRRASERRCHYFLYCRLRHIDDYPLPSSPKDKLADIESDRRRPRRRIGDEPSASERPSRVLATDAVLIDEPFGALDVVTIA
jgi:hypothetical protein